MFIITLIIGIITGLIALTAISHFTKNLPTLTLLTVLTVVAGMSLGKIYVISYLNAATYEYFLIKNDPVCKLIAKTYPVKFNGFITKIKQIIRSNKGKDTQLFNKIELLNAIFNITASKATSQSIYDYYQTEVNMYQNLYQLDPEVVLYMEFSSHYKKTLNPGLAVLLNGEDNLKNLIAKKEAVIESAIVTPQPPLTTADKEQAAKLLRDILEKLQDQYGKDTINLVMSDPMDPTLDKAQAAAFIIAFYQSILTLPADDVGMIFKYFYSGQVPSENRDETSAKT